MIMSKVRITAIRQTVYEDLMAKYENPIEHTCDVVEGQQCISVDGKCPEGMCPSACLLCASLWSRWPEAKATSTTDG